MVKKTSKGENKAFPSPSSPCNVVPLIELLRENNKHPSFEQWGGGRGVDSFVSTILSPIVDLAEKGQK